MADGVILRADRFAGRGPARRPTVLIRSPYGRRGVWGLAYGRPLAAAGWSVVIASVRGASGASDRFDQPMVHEAADGAATVAWLRRQAWWDGRLATIGMSYLGITQWALAVDPPPELAAMVVQAAPHEMATATWPGGTLALSNSLGWAQLVGGPWRQPGPAQLRGARRRRADLTRALAPDADPAGTGETGGDGGGRSSVATGATVAWWEDWASHGPDDPYWDAYDRSAALGLIDVPVLLQGGWLDTFRRPVLDQHAALRRRGVPVGLTVGPWTHSGMALGWPGLMGEAIDWIDAAFEGRAPRPRVRTAVLGAGRPSWRRWPSWPPPSTATVWGLAQAGRLELAPPAAGPPPGAAGPPPGPAEPTPGPLATVAYDPSDPTPQIGGDLLGPGAGRRDQAAVEARGDVAVWTGPRLGAPVEVAGTVTAQVLVAHDAPCQVVVRLCDVDGAGRSIGVCDGIVALPAPRPGPGPSAGPGPGPAAAGSASAGAQGGADGGDGMGGTWVDVDLGPVAARWAGGHHLRVQICAGAWPRALPAPLPAVLAVVAGRVTLPVVST